MNIAIINCASQKATHGCKAIEMYKSPLFKAQSTLSNLIYDECYILSGKYGIIKFDTIIEPYNLSLHSKRLLTTNVISDSDKQLLKQNIASQIQIMLDNGCSIDFHLSNDYYDIISKQHKQHPNTQRFKPFKVQNWTSQLYNDAIALFNSGADRNEVIYYLLNTKMYKRERVSEQRNWWYHPIIESFWGRSDELAKAHNVNNGNLFQHYHSDVVKTNHVEGWTNKLENIKHLKLVNGKWRYKK